MPQLGYKSFVSRFLGAFNYHTRIPLGFPSRTSPVASAISVLNICTQKQETFSQLFIAIFSWFSTGTSLLLPSETFLK